MDFCKMALIVSLCVVVVRCEEDLSFFSLCIYYAGKLNWSYGDSFCDVGSSEVGESLGSSVVQRDKADPAPPQSSGFDLNPFH